MIKHTYVILSGNPNEVDMSSPLIYGTPSSRVEGTPHSGVRGTPARQRPDLGSVRKAPQVDLHSEPVSGQVRIYKNKQVVYGVLEKLDYGHCNNLFRVDQIKWFSLVFCSQVLMEL